MDLTIKYKRQLKEISKTSKTISSTLRYYYTDDYLKTFNDFNDFLNDIDGLCEEGGIGKVLFIKEVENKFIENNKF